MQIEMAELNGKLSVHIFSGGMIAINRERKPNTRERKADPEATVIAEWVHISFPTKAKPEIRMTSELK